MAHRYDGRKYKAGDLITIRKGLGLASLKAREGKRFEVDSVSSSGIVCRGTRPDEPADLFREDWVEPYETFKEGDYASIRIGDAARDMGIEDKAYFALVDAGILRVSSSLSSFRQDIEIDHPAARGYSFRAEWLWKEYPEFKVGQIVRFNTVFTSKETGIPDYEKLLHHRFTIQKVRDLRTYQLKERPDLFVSENWIMDIAPADEHLPMYIETPTLENPNREMLLGMLNDLEEEKKMNGVLQTRIVEMDKHINDLNGRIATQYETIKKQRVTMAKDGEEITSLNSRIRTLELALAALAPAETEAAL